MSLGSLEFSGLHSLWPRYTQHLRSIHLSQRRNLPSFTGKVASSCTLLTCCVADETYEPLIKHASASEEGEFMGRKSSRSSSLSQAIGSSTVPLSSPNDVENTPKTKKYKISEIPWAAMFTHPACLTLFLLNWVFGWIGFMLLTEMPSFLNDQLGYDLESSGLLSIAPYAANLVSVAMFAQIYDHLEVLHYLLPLTSSCFSGKERMDHS